jgi:hypothetical protein
MNWRRFWMARLGGFVAELQDRDDWIMWGGAAGGIGAQVNSYPAPGFE